MLRGDVPLLHHFADQLEGVFVKAEPQVQAVLFDAVMRALIPSAGAFASQPPAVVGSIQGR
jgi:hypothetical protein